MKQKSDAKKRQEGRCLGTGNLYVGFIKANEIGSIGTSTAIYDPIAERTVDTLSMGEKEFFWIMRFRDDVAQIQEQMMLLPRRYGTFVRNMDFAFRGMSCPRIFSLHSVTAAGLHTASSQERKSLIRNRRNTKLFWFGNILRWNTGSDMASISGLSYGRT